MALTRSGAATRAPVLVHARTPRSLEGLAAALEVLASPTRLHLLHALRTPQALHEIRVQPSRSRAGERPERPLTRQAVTGHLEALRRAGLVRVLPARDDREGARFLLNHEHVFALVDEMRNLAKLRPLVQEGWTAGRTIEERAPAPAGLPEGPRLMVAYGRDDGIAFGLARGVGTRWRIGRAASCDIRLDYDPYLSSVHATIDRERDGYRLRDAGSRNGTLVNWTRMEPGGTRSLAPGDLLTLGRTVLAFQP